MMAERDNIPRMLSQLKRQSFKEFTLYVCVNQPEGDDTFTNNQESIALLQSEQSIDITIIDRSSIGLGWKGKQKGVGWARKLLFSCIQEHCNKDELIVSLDADTAIADNYFEDVLATMNSHPAWSALSAPYYHPLSGNEKQDRAILRYECYMRYYLINLLLIENPYAFTALGSAIIFPMWAYERVGGISPMQAGEDFYLMQKFVKTGTIGNKIVSNPEQHVEPEGRISFRVPFGTGPAISKGIDSMDESYPFYSEETFAEIGETFRMMPALFDNDRMTPMTEFLKQQLRCENPWSSIRRNFKSKELFIHACYERVDGLRILQYLRLKHHPSSSQSNLISFCNNHNIDIPNDLSFIKSSMEDLIKLREQFFQWEISLR